jgi:3-oxoacyl-(acyl-carrier-protein) synthase
MPRVVITGIGLVSALGNCKECFWNGMCNGLASFRRITRFETNPLAEVYAAEVLDFEGAFPVKPKQAWTTNRSIQFAVSAAGRALADAGIAVDDVSRTHIGVVFGSTQSCLDLAVKLDVDGLIQGPRTVNPTLFPHVNPSAPSCRVSLHFGLQAFNTTLSNGPTSGLDAIYYASNAIRDGLAPIALAGGVEELTRMTFLFHNAMEDLATLPSSFAPFAEKGILLGEGCAVLVLEDEDHAHNRGANVLAEVAGYGSCFGPGENSEDDNGESLEYAMCNAIQTAGMRQEDIDVVFASANGAIGRDRVEAGVLQRIFPSARVAAPKARLGETHSAAGALHAAACVLAMNRGELPAGVMLGKAQPAPTRAALINCFSTSLGTQTRSSLVLKSAQARSK